MSDPLLHQFWIEFETPSPLPQRFGVTALDLADALRLIDAWLGDRRRTPPPPIARVIEDVDVSTLDPGHVLPNMLPPTWRGVWYPMSSLS